MINSKEQLTKALLHTCGRIAFNEEQILEIIGDSPKNRNAYQLCDGTKAQKDIVKETKVDVGNFSRIVSKWVGAGILFQIEEGKETRLLHVYPLSLGALKKGNKK